MAGQFGPTKPESHMIDQTPLHSYTTEEALEFHRRGKPGKLEIAPTKPLVTARDLSLAYSPGVAIPCLEIERDPAAAFDLTSKGNTVAVISNGSAVLGLGNLGALASKPVMEGKAVLFKRFADIDAIDIEVDTEDVDKFVQTVHLVAHSWGGINLEDIKAPECFIIEQQLSAALDIPVFHDDQHGTAIIAVAGLLNALDLTGRTLADTRIVINGAGAAGIACAELLQAMGCQPGSIILCDRTGVIYQGRDGLNQWKSGHAVRTSARTLADALKGADVAFGLSAKGAFTADMMRSMAAKPVVFAMANPDPEIRPEHLAEVREDAIVATGRSDYPNQVNNVLGFPYIFRGALDVRASTINMEMKIAATEALAALAREDVPDEVAAAYADRALRYGPEHIIPKPFDPRLITQIPPAVAEAAIASGVAKRPIRDSGEYQRTLATRLDRTASFMQVLGDRVRATPRRMVFAEGDESRMIRAAARWRDEGYGTPVLVGNEERVLASMDQLGIRSATGLEILNAAVSQRTDVYTDFLYGRLARRGYLRRDCQRLVNRNRNVFSACAVALGDADALVTGTTRNHYSALADIRRVIDPPANGEIFGLSIAVTGGRTLFIADSTIHETPSPSQLADIAVGAALAARRFGHEPKVALLSFANFGQPMSPETGRVRRAVEILDEREADFAYDGEMAPDIALRTDLQEHYPICRLNGPANVLVMPGLHAASIAVHLLCETGGCQILGPMLTGLTHSAQITRMGARVSEIVTAGILAAHGVEDGD